MLTASQIRALDREPDFDPALQPDDGAARVRMGTTLADLGDVAAAQTVVSTDAGGTYTSAEQDLINELKANVNFLMAELAKLARS